jgi:hypothetical protein
MNDTTLLVAHAAVTWSLCGLIWFVQLVHYPLMLEVPAAAAVAYEQAHCRRITPLVAPLMLLEAGLAAWLCLWPPAGRPLGLLLAGAVLLAIVWLSTFLVQVPLHDQLSRGDDLGAKQRLVRSNWLRTAAWTLRAGIATALLGCGS